MILDVFYIGEKFYYKSSTMMSSIYLNDGGVYRRFNWGLVQIALEEGAEVHLRPAKDEEMLWAYKQLDKITKEE